MNFLEEIKKTSELLKSNHSLKYQDIDLTLIDIDENQPRKSFNDLKDLTDSIKIHGVISPITIRKNDDRYILCYGERRYRASIEAGLTHIPAVIIDDEFNDLLEKQLVENIQRQELSFDEITNAISYLIDTKKRKKKDVAKSIGKSNAYITLYYNFGKIDEKIKNMLLEKTKDITLIVEINRILSTVEDDLYEYIYKFIQSLEVINRNSINIINKLIANGGNLDELNENTDTNRDVTIENYIDDENSNDNYINNDDNEDEFDDMQTDATQTSNNNEINEVTVEYNRELELDELRCQINDVNTGETLLTLDTSFYAYLEDNDKLKKLLNFLKKI